MWAQGSDLTQNPLLGGGVVAAGFFLIALLVRLLMRSDTRWERLTGAQGDELDRTLERLESAEQKAELALARAIKAEQALDHLREVHERAQATCQAEVAALRVELSRLTGGATA